MSQIFKMYSVRDSKSNAFNPPFYAINEETGLRSFAQLVLDPAQTVSKFPEDFDLYHVGDYDDESGKISPQETPVHVQKAISVLNRN